VAVEEGIKQNDAIFNNSQLRSFLDDAKAESQVIFGGDKTLEKNYDTIIDEFVKIQNSKSNKLSDLLQSRKDFDAVINKKFPNIFDKFGTDNVRANAVKDVRNKVNQFIAEALPEGNEFRDELFEISDMYKAIDNIAAQTAGKVNKNIIERTTNFIRKNPILSVAGATGLTISSLTGVLANPVTLSILAGGTAIKLGKRTVSSRNLKRALVSILEQVEEKGLKMAPKQKQAFDSLILGLPDVDIPEDLLAEEDDAS